MARLTRRDFRPGPSPLTDLPFVADVKVSPRQKRRSFWNVPPTDDHGAAVRMGRQYACDWLQYIKDNPFWVGSGSALGRIAVDMNAQPEGAMRGYAVGFWSALEVMLHRAATAENHWDALDIGEPGDEFTEADSMTHGVNHV